MRLGSKTKHRSVVVTAPLVAQWLGLKKGNLQGQEQHHEHPDYVQKHLYPALFIGHHSTCGAL